MFDIRTKQQVLPDSGHQPAHAHSSAARLGLMRGPQLNKLS